MNRVAIVTGGTSGIGLGICQRLAIDGWDLVVTGSRPAERAEETIHDLRISGAQVAYVRGDIALSQTRSEIVAVTLDVFGRVDALVNNAGITSPDRKDFLDATEESFDRVVAVNVKAPYFLAQLVSRQMIRQRADDSSFRGTIVNVSSVSADVVSVNRGDYCISKAGLSMANRVMAVRLGEHGIDCFEVRPGLILTDMTAGVREKYDAMIASGRTIDRRWGTPEDVGTVVGSLLDGGMPYSTGQVIRVDGGLTIETL